MVLGAAFASASVALASAGPEAGASSSSNNIQSKSANQIVSAAVSATRSANSFTLNGSVSGYSFQNLSLSKSGNAQGTISHNNGTIRLIGVNGTIYFQADRTFWNANGGQAAANLFIGKWVTGNPNNPDIQSIKNSINTQSLTQSFGNTSGSTYTKGNTSTINGQKVIAVNAQQGNTKGTIYVATTGQPYIIRLNVPGHGQLTFSNYNKPVRPSVPRSSVNIDKLNSSSGTGSS